MEEPAQPPGEGPLFEEVQRFRQAWIVFTVLAISIFTYAMFGYGIYQQLILGKPWGDQPMSDHGLIIFSVFILSVVLLTDIMVLGATLTVKVQGLGLYIHYWPVVRRFIPWEQIETYNAVTYSPIMEYGGWGIRGFGKKIAYNVSGNRGVLLELNNGRSLLIGSQAPERLEQAIRMAMGQQVEA